MDANAELDATIRKVAIDLGIAEEGEVIASWMLIGHRVAPTEDGRSRYFHAFSGGEIPLHVALGLLDLARHDLLEDDDD